MGLDVVSKSGGAKEIRIYILELKLFLTFHDKTEFGDIWDWSSEERRTIAQEFKAAI